MCRDRVGEDVYDVGKSQNTAVYSVRYGVHISEGLPWSPSQRLTRDVPLIGGEPLQIMLSIAMDTQRRFIPYSKQSALVQTDKTCWI